MQHRRSARRGVAAAATAMLISGSLVGFASPAGAGQSWSIVANPKGIGDVTLSGVACTSATNCIMVGDSATGRWNGSKWSAVPHPDPAGALAMLFGIACSGATNCFAVGLTRPDSYLDTTLVERWNGAKWSIVPSPSPTGSGVSRLNGVSCSSAKNCFAVGSFAPSGPGRSETLVERWNGAKWSIMPSPNPAGSLVPRLERVECSSATSCLAVGFVANDVFTVAKTLVERWNGTTWSIVPTPNGPPDPVHHDDDSDLHGVACTHPTTCFAVGSSGAGHAMVEQWNGKAWSIIATPSVVGVLDGVSCASATSCTAVGEALDAENAVGTLAEHWDGAKWSIVASPNPDGLESSHLLDVACTSKTKCVAVGDSDNFGPGGQPLVERSK